MTSLSIRDIPDDLYARLRELAARERRSVNRQVIVLIEASLAADAQAEGQRLRADIAAQVQAWQRLAEQFAADVDIAAEDILNARTAGRPVEL